MVIGNLKVTFKNTKEVITVILNIIYKRKLKGTLDPLELPFRYKHLPVSVREYVKCQEIETKDNTFMLLKPAWQQHFDY